MKQTIAIYFNRLLLALGLLCLAWCCTANAQEANAEETVSHSKQVDIWNSPDLQVYPGAQDDRVVGTLC